MGRLYHYFMWRFLHRLEGRQSLILHCDRDLRGHCPIAVGDSVTLSFAEDSPSCGAATTHLRVVSVSASTTCAIVELEPEKR